MKHSQLGMACGPVTKIVNESMHGYKALICIVSMAKNIASHFILSHINHCVSLHTLST